MSCKLTSVLCLCPLRLMGAEAVGHLQKLSLVSELKRVCPVL